MFHQSSRNSICASHRPLGSFGGDGKTPDGRIGVCGAAEASQTLPGRENAISLLDLYVATDALGRFMPI